MTGFFVIIKTIDNVDHIIALDKLYGMIGSFYNLITSYFEHRYQRVQIDTKFNYNMVHSESESITNVYRRINPWSFNISCIH
jgi:hypothetical protein